MAPEQMHILRVPITDSSEDGYLLINVTSNGPSPLDLKLLATEGIAPYIATIKTSRISKLRSKRNTLNPADWETTLQSFLCQHDTSSPPLQAKDLDKLEASASLSSTDDTITLNLRHNISGITLNLGSILFTKDESQEIDIFTWCSLSMQRSDALEIYIQNLTSQLTEQKETIEKLEQQLEDLIQAKKSHEEELLGKFALLLNEKKLKIREQQRLLAGAKVDPNGAKKVERAKEVTKGRTPEASRKGKRKVDVKDEESGDEDEDGFENTRVVTQGRPNAEDADVDGEEQVETPDPSEEDVTEDEDDDDLDTGGEDQGQRRPETGKKDEQMQVDALPPSRELPFGKHVGAGREVEVDRSNLNQEAGNEDEETDETDDDEL